MTASCTVALRRSSRADATKQNLVEIYKSKSCFHERIVEATFGVESTVSDEVFQNHYAHREASTFTHPLEVKRQSSCGLLVEQNKPLVSLSPITCGASQVSSSMIRASLQPSRGAESIGPSCLLCKRRRYCREKCGVS